MDHPEDPMPDLSKISIDGLTGEEAIRWFTPITSKIMDTFESGGEFDILEVLKLLRQLEYKMHSENRAAEDADQVTVSRDELIELHSKAITALNKEVFPGS